MKNITLSVDEDVLAAVRRHAAERNSTVNALVREYFTSLASQHGRAATVAAIVVLGLAFALPVVEFVRLHPYQYTHFNNIAGRVPGADGRYMRDYWGLSFRQAAQALPVFRWRRMSPGGCR